MTQPSKEALSYRDSGVDIDAGDELVVDYVDASGACASSLEGLEAGAGGLSLGMTIGCLWAPVILAAQAQMQTAGRKAA